MSTNILTALRRARTGDRDLDVAVMRALGWEVRTPADFRYRMSYRMRWPGDSRWISLPHVTTDEGAAFRLLPIDWDWSIAKTSRSSANDRFKVHLSNRKRPGDQKRLNYIGVGNTLCLAICGAAVLFNTGR